MTRVFNRVVGNVFPTYADFASLPTAAQGAVTGAVCTNANTSSNWMFDGSAWVEISEGDNPSIVEYSVTKSYAADDLCSLNGAIYRALGATTGDDPEDDPSTDWELISLPTGVDYGFLTVNPALGDKPTFIDVMPMMVHSYNSGYTYAADTVVHEDGVFYKALTTSTGSHPESSRTDWEILTVGPWLASVTYGTGTICSYNSHLFVSLTEQSGNTPVIGGDVNWADITAGSVLDKDFTVLRLGSGGTWGAITVADGDGSYPIGDGTNAFHPIAANTLERIKGVVMIKGTDNTGTPATFTVMWGVEFTVMRESSSVTQVGELLIDEISKDTNCPFDYHSTTGVPFSLTMSGTGVALNYTPDNTDGSDVEIDASSLIFPNKPLTI